MAFNLNLLFELRPLVMSALRAILSHLQGIYRCLRPEKLREKIVISSFLAFTYVFLMRIIPIAKKKAPGPVGSSSRGRCNRRVIARSTLNRNSSGPAIVLGRGRSVYADIRQQRAEEVAQSRIQVRSSGYIVPSQSNGNKLYTVQLNPDSCECEDFELRGKPCKHILGVRLWMERRDLTKEEPKAPQEREPSPKLPRKTYRQKWPEYNAAQTNEKDHFQELLAELCRTVSEPPAKPGRGRPPIPLSDALFAAVFKVYSTLSARRFACDLEEAGRRGHICHAPHFNSVLNALENEELTPILINLIQASAVPLTGVETTFAIDSSGFCSSRFIRWYDVKYGVTREEADWVKVHIVCGTKTHIVTAVTILEKHTADITQLPALVAETSRNFTIHEMSADKAYLSGENFDALAAVGGTLYAPFKSNSTGAAGGIFEKMFHYFCILREEYLNHYHRRSNVESVFSMVKRKFGDSVRSKTETAMKNEALCKLLAHNLCCLISAWYELGIEPMLSTAKPQDDGPRDILPLVRS